MIKNKISSNVDSTDDILEMQGMMQPRQNVTGQNVTRKNVTEPNFVVIVSRIIHVKVGWSSNAAKKFKDQRRLSSFVGHPAIQNPVYVY